MPQRAQIWYFEHSLAAPLARPLSRRYAVRALPPPSPGQRTSAPELGDAPVVCLADLGAGDLVADSFMARITPGLATGGEGFRASESRSNVKEQLKGSEAEVPNPDEKPTDWFGPMVLGGIKAPTTQRAP